MFSSVSFPGVVHNTEHQCSHCAITVRNLLPCVRGFNKMAAECSYASGSSASSKRSVFAGSTLKKLCTVKIAVKGRLSLKLVIGFVRRSSHTMETITMHEHINASTLLRPKPKQVKIETFTSSKTCTRERVDHISTLAVGVIVCNLCPVNLGNSVGLKVFIAHLEPGCRLPSDRYFYYASDLQL